MYTRLPARTRKRRYAVHKMNACRHTHTFACTHTCTSMLCTHKHTQMYAHNRARHVRTHSHTYTRTTHQFHTNLDDGDASREPCHALLQLFDLKVLLRVGDEHLDGCHTLRDRLLRLPCAHDCARVLAHDYTCREPQHALVRLPVRVMVITCVRVTAL